MEYEATELRGNCWAVRPKGQLGTCGWHPKPWTVIYVKAKTAKEAIRKAMKQDHVSGKMKYGSEGREFEP